MSSGESFDLAAAGLRADGADLRISLEVLASKLEQSLPDSAHVERSGGGLLGRHEKRVRMLRVDLGGMRYQLAIDGPRVECFRERQVGGIAIKHEPLDPGPMDRRAGGRPAQRGPAQRPGENRAREPVAVR